MTYSYFIKANGLDKPLAFSDNPLSFNKQLIYVGEFVKDGVKYKVDEALIDNWVNEHNILASFGFKVKLPIEHTFDPESNRGHVNTLFKARDSKDRISLFGNLTFLDAESAKLAFSTDVSIFSPPSYKLGTGYVSKRPITHVALTDYPLVPGLEGFKTLAASLLEVPTMTMAELAKMLGIDIPADVTDEAAIAELIAGEFAKIRDAGKPPVDPPADTDPAIAASMTKLTKQSRKHQIASLVASRKMTPAEAKDWNTAYVDNFAFSNTDDGFDKSFGLAEKRSPLLDTGSQTGRQTRVADADNPLLADAKRRAGVK